MFTVEYSSALKRGDILSFVTIGMNLEDIMPSEKKPDTERLILHVLVYNMDSNTVKLTEVEFNSTIPGALPSPQEEFGEASWHLQERQFINFHSLPATSSYLSICLSIYLSV
jgi:hypothetical protein